jgi:hypothetical protein
MSTSSKLLRHSSQNRSTFFNTSSSRNNITSGVGDPNESAFLNILHHPDNSQVSYLKRIHKCAKSSCFTNISSTSKLPDKSQVYEKIKVPNVETKGLGLNIEMTDKQYIKMTQHKKNRLQVLERISQYQK